VKDTENVTLVVKWEVTPELLRNLALALESEKVVSVSIEGKIPIEMLLVRKYI